MSEKKTNNNDQVEQPLIDTPRALKSSFRRENTRFLKRNECEEVLDQEQFEDKDEFYSKIENLNIQIYESDNDENNLDEEERKNSSVKETDSDTVELTTPYECI